MKYRKLDANGDYTFGHGDADYHTDTPEGVAQAVLTRLRLRTGEWFLDTAEGTPYAPAILGKHTRQSHDFALRRRVLETAGVNEIVDYESLFDGDTRGLSVHIRTGTVYGPASLVEVL